MVYMLERVVENKDSENRTERSLRLMYLVKDSVDGPSISANELPVPSSVDLSRVASVALDDSLGLVFFLTVDGNLFTVSYE